jgi:sec-independent protein translocase protein TatC
MTDLPTEPPALHGKYSVPAEMHLFDHLAELRKRLLIALCAVTIGSIIGYVISPEFFELLTAPYHRTFENSLLIGTGPAEAFVLKIKVGIFAGFFLSLPVLFLQLWMFIEPGLLPSEKKLVIPFVLSTTLLFAGGAWFCYDVVFPVAFQFFYEQYQSISITPTIRLDEHLAFVMRSIVAFGVMFEMPVLAFLLGRIGILTDTMMIKGARYAIVAIFIVAAVLTPPDAFTQVLMAVPLLILYGASILVVRWTAKRREVSAQEELP